MEATSEPKYKAAFSLAYGAGLRVAEIAALKVSDIDSKRMLVRIEQGKRRKDRYAVLSSKMLELLRDWWRIARPRFPGQDPTKPISTRQLNRAVQAAACKAGIDKRVSPHTSRQRRAFSATRHSFATHLLEEHVDIRVIQVLLETETYCPPTADRRADLLSVPSSMRRSCALYEAIYLSRCPAGRHSATGRIRRLYPRLDDAAIIGASSGSRGTEIFPGYSQSPFENWVNG